MAWEFIYNFLGFKIKSKIFNKNTVSFQDKKI